MEQSMNNRADELLDRLSGSLTRWVLGFGLLSLHATVFTVSMIAMVLWNIYSAPGDLWVDEVFRRWGAVVAFHAIAVVAGTTAWRLLRAEQMAMSAQRPEPSALARPAPIATFDLDASHNGWHSGAPAQEGPAQRYAETAHRAEDMARRTLSAAAIWSAAFARRTKRAVAESATKWTHHHDAPAPPAPAVTDPTMTWPQSPVRHRVEEQEFITRFAAGEPAAVETPAAPAPGGGVDIVLNVGGISLPNRPETSPAPAVGKEPGQTWVEAATHAWHLPRDPGNGSPAADASGNEERSPETPPTDPDPQSSTQ